MSTNDSEWNSQQEDYLKKLHFQSIENYKFWNIKNLKYQRISKYFNIPILVISARNEFTLCNDITRLHRSRADINNECRSVSVDSYTGICSVILENK